MGAWRYANNITLDRAAQERITALCNAGRSGKWMLFTDPAAIHESWATVVAATESGELGWAAKAATRHVPGRDVLICVYTEDWRNRRDLARVLAQIRQLGFSDRLSYKEDAATDAPHYGAGAALYVAQPGTVSFSQRRPAYEPDDAEHAPSEGEQLTAEQLFACDPTSYGPFPSDGSVPRTM